MNPTHRTHRLSVTLAGLAAAALALPACQNTATAASHRHHHPAHARGADANACSADAKRPEQSPTCKTSPTSSGTSSGHRRSAPRDEERHPPPPHAKASGPAGRLRAQSPPLKARNGHSAHVAKANPPSPRGA